MCEPVLSIPSFRVGSGLVHPIFMLCWTWDPMAWNKHLPGTIFFGAAWWRLVIPFLRLKGEKHTFDSLPYTISAKPGKASKDQQLYSALTKTCGGCWFYGNAMYLLSFTAIQKIQIMVISYQLDITRIQECQNCNMTAIKQQHFNMLQ